MGAAPGWIARDGAIPRLPIRALEFVPVCPCARSVGQPVLLQPRHFESQPRSPRSLLLEKSLWVDKTQN